VDEQGRSNVAEVAQSAAGKSRDVATDASQQAKEVAGTAREQVGQVGQEVAAQGQRVLDEAKGKLREQSEQQSAQLASTLRSWSGQARALADGRAEEAGPLRDYTNRAADKVAEVADRFDERGLEGALEDAKAFARRRPGVFLLGAGIAGFAAGRLLRGASSAAPTSPTPAASALGNSGPPRYQAPLEPAGASAAPVGAAQTSRAQ
jgi:hypothetical protein